METHTEIRIANRLPDPAETARCIHRQAAALVIPCACGSTHAVQWRGDRRGLRVYSCDDCASIESTPSTASIK